MRRTLRRHAASKQEAISAPIPSEQLQQDPLCIFRVPGSDSCSAILQIRTFLERGRVGFLLCSRQTTAPLVTDVTRGLASGEKILRISTAVPLNHTESRM